MAKQQIVLSEKYLLNALGRIARNPEGYAVLYIKASKLKPKHRHPKFLKILEKFFDGVVGLATGVFFPLSNGDFVILGRGFSQSIIDVAVDKLREGTYNDPILHGKNSSDFAAVFEFPEHFADFYTYIYNLVETGPANQFGAQVEAEKRAIDAGEIDQVLSILEQIDVSELVKRQSVVQIQGANQFKVKSQEFFVAVKDLNMLFEGVDLQANKWLYFYMLQHLDKRVLKSFFAAQLKQWPDEICVNLNLNSVYSQEFIDFAKEFSKRGHKIIVEVQLIDVFNNLPLYFEVKEILGRGNHKILIDGVNLPSLKLMNIKNLNPNMVKIFWETLMEHSENNEEVRQIIELLGRDNVVLAKCDSSQALSWGLRHGITSFQGPYMDNIEVSVVRQQCPNVSYCSMKECLRRKRLLSGKEHECCLQRDVLEKLL